MNLRERLALVQTRRVPSKAEPESSTPFAGYTSVPLSQRLRRLVAAQTDAAPLRAITPQELARLLGGEFCEGVILIEDAVPLSQWHGSIPFGEISRVSLEFLAGGTEPPRERLQNYHSRTITTFVREKADQAGGHGFQRTPTSSYWLLVLSHH